MTEEFVEYRPSKDSLTPSPLLPEGELMLVHWIDSTGDSGEWTATNDIPSEAQACQSIGHVIRANEHSVSLAMSVTTGGDQVLGYLVLPREAITRAWRIDKKKGLVDVVDVPLFFI